jgi:5'-nucleotidase
MDRMGLAPARSATMNSTRASKELLRQQHGGCDSPRRTRPAASRPASRAPASPTWPPTWSTQRPASPGAGLAHRRRQGRQGRPDRRGAEGHALGGTASGIAGLSFLDEADADQRHAAGHARAGRQVFVVLIHEGGHTGEPSTSSIATASKARSSASSKSSTRRSAWSSAATRTRATCARSTAAS